MRAMAKKSITKIIKIEYDYVIFDGTNFDEIKKFVGLYNLYGNETLEESFHKRPEDIPNLDEDDLLKWWESTGEERVDSRDRSGRRYNTHNSNNMPLWRKDELLMIECTSCYDHYNQREWLKKNDAIIWINRRHYVLNNTNEKKVMDFIENYLYE